LAGDEGGAGFTAAKGELAEAQVESALEGIAFAMAVEAMGFEDGSDVLFEVETAGGFGSRCGGGSRGGVGGKGEL
jgi:hypothetical protein